MSHEELDDLIHGYMDDRLTAEQVVTLNQALRNSTLAREQFWHLAELEGYLTDLADWRRGQEHATDLALPEALEVFLEMEQEATPALRAFEPPSEPIALPHPTLWKRMRSKGQKAWPVVRRYGKGLAAVVAIGLILLLANEFISPPESRTPGNAQQVTEDRPPSEAPQETPAPMPVVAATVTRVFGNASPTHRGGLSVGTQLLAGESVQLETGFVELQMASGTSLILQGPGEFLFESINAVTMTTGRATATVPPAATGFALYTPLMDFIDHGTEFGVSLDGHGGGEILVFDGLVEAKSPAAQQPPGASPARTMMISEGLGGKIHPGQALPRSLQAVESFESQLYARNWDQVTYLPRFSGQISMLDTAPPVLVDGVYLTLEPVLIKEARGVVVDRPLSVNNIEGFTSALLKENGSEAGARYDLAAGTKVNAFLIHLDRLDSGTSAIAECQFTITFPGEVLGVMHTIDELIQSDAMLGLPDVVYPQGKSKRGSRDAPGTKLYDELSLSEDGRTLTVMLRVSGMDQLRVLVRNTDTPGP